MEEIREFNGKLYVLIYLFIFVVDTYGKYAN